MDIKINQRPAILGLNITYPKVEAEHKPAKMFLQPSSASLKIKQESGKLVVDNSEPLKAIGYYGAKLYSQIIGQKSQQKVHEDIAKAVEEGFQLADIHLSEGAITDIAVENSWRKERQIEVGFKPGPDVEFTKGGFEIIPEEERVKIDISKGQFDLNAVLGKVDMYLLQKPYFDTEYVGQEFDLRG